MRCCALSIQVFVSEPRPAEAIVDLLNKDFTELVYNETQGAAAGRKPKYWRDDVTYLSESQDIDTRSKIMQQFKDQENIVLVTEDMAGRGLDVPTLRSEEHTSEHKTLIS